jgi:hypothetical protein
MELDCANSSDALLMNIFCYRRALENRALSSLLGVASGLVPAFGFRPGIPLRNGKTDRTEIDMRLGDLMVEAKLTESDFQTTSARMIERYRDLEEILDSEELTRSGDAVQCYQLIRGVLAAHATGGSFCVFCDERRPDLIENWYSVMRAVRSCVLRCRLQLLTWQEMTALLPRPLQIAIPTTTRRCAVKIAFVVENHAGVRLRAITPAKPVNHVELPTGNVRLKFCPPATCLSIGKNLRCAW